MNFMRQTRIPVHLNVLALLFNIIVLGPIFSEVLKLVHMKLKEILNDVPL